MKNKKNLLAVFEIGILLLAACMVPTFVTTLEDRHLQSESKKYEIEEIKLGSKKVDLTEKLSAMQKVLTDYVVVQKSNADSTQSQNEVEKKVKEYLSMLYDDTTETEFSVFSAVQIMIADANIDKVYSLWKCSAVDENKCEYIFWLDKDTEKVLAFEIPFFFTEKDAEEFYKMTEKMARYYGFTGAELTEEAREFLSQKYARETLCFLDATKGTEVPLMLYRKGGRLNFNMYSGNIDVYDSTSSLY